MGASEVIGIIQIIVGLLALVLAIIGYFKILHQIKISNEQTLLTIEQNRNELKLNLTCSYLKAYELASSLILKHDRTVMQIYQFKEYLEKRDSSDPDIEVVNQFSLDHKKEIIALKVYMDEIDVIFKNKVNVDIIDESECNNLLRKLNGDLFEAFRRSSEVQLGVDRFEIFRRDFGL